MIMSREDKIKAVKELLSKNPIGVFNIPDNCPGDGWCGELCEDGAYVLGHENFYGEWFKYEDIDEVVLDTILSEAVFD